MILAAVAGPIPGSVSSSLGRRVVEVDRAGRADRPAGGRADPHPRSSALATGSSSRDGTRIWSPSCSGAARFSSRPARAAVDARPVAAGRRQQVADARTLGHPEDARVAHRPDDLDDDLAVTRRPARLAGLSRRSRSAGCRVGVPPTTATEPDDPAAERQRECGKGEHDGTADRDHRRPRDGPEPRRSRERLAVPCGDADTAGSSRTRHGVGLGSTRRPPRRAVARRRHRQTRRLATLGALPTRRDVIRTLATAAYLRLISPRAVPPGTVGADRER